MKTESLEKSLPDAKSLTGGQFRKRISLSYDFFLFCLLTAFILTIGFINPAFFSWGTLFDVLRNRTIYILLGLCLLPIVILGGFDVSFVAVSSLSTLLARLIFRFLGIDASIGLYYFMSIIAGASCGMLIGWTVNRYKLSIFSFSLGVTSMLNGLMTMGSSLGIQGAPVTALKGWNMRWLVTVQTAAGRSGLHVSILTVIAAAIILHLFLKYTVWGREIYAAGSHKSVAIRTGIDMKKIYMVAFAITGSIASIASVTSSGLGAGSSPFGEKFMTVYATVIIGGASVNGGKGTVAGTIMGVLLVGLIAQAMVYVRIPTEWMELVLGLLLIAFSIYQIVDRKISD